MNQDILALINRRRRQLVVHSYLYYRLNESIIADHDFDIWSKELVELQRDYPEESEAGVYADEFRDFDGSTGYHLPQDTWACTVAHRLLRLHKEAKR